jgi:hypothetical protein
MKNLGVSHIQENIWDIQHKLDTEQERSNPKGENPSNRMTWDESSLHYLSSLYLVLRKKLNLEDSLWLKQHKPPLADNRQIEELEKLNILQLCSKLYITTICLGSFFAIDISDGYRKAQSKKLVFSSIAPPPPSYLPESEDEKMNREEREVDEILQKDLNLELNTNWKLFLWKSSKRRQQRSETLLYLLHCIITRLELYTSKGLESLASMNLMFS